MIDYKEFAKAELNRVIPIQNRFKEEFDIDSYTNWFYDDESGILRLYNNDDDEIFFKYIPIGTFSLSQKTWMWSWLNNSLVVKSKIETLKIKQFGEENQFEKLTTGTFPSDEFDGWEFLAISQKVLNGIGVYKINGDKLNYYLLLTEILNPDGNQEIIKLKQKIVDCGYHGFKRPAFICQHLELNSSNGFEEAFETFPGMDLDEDDDFSAWCDECEKKRTECDGWNDESEEFAKIKLICEDFYFEIKESNQKIT
ncbi:hypothetical protein NG800_009845 [Epilithonimonas ginsengisoli]|uniref:Uncharacterized protein n=1 Tax=Epilithonimonas ginsengisoli TaxID=1245592 RepID=A0ABU4JI09_9FLAO|nr:MULTISPECIES: DUF6882 domain-containing protein [Chryseobacterium group]MDW8549213.1 hypothetical protein [Epilithonimonas ginsengisoli]OAH70360.1 hypothetical protein AXA65_13380 [Chryseobacterium sp. FP211-J200]